MQAIALEDLDSGLAEIRAAPPDRGTVELLVRRPAKEERELLEQAELDPVQGLIGDYWSTTGASPDTALTVMSARAAALVAGPRAQWALAGDQLYVDLDLSDATLPPGTRLSVGSAVIEVTTEPHTGCGKFLRRYGVDAQKLVNSPVGRELNLRGINARVVQAGVVSRGDAIAKLVTPTKLAI